MNRNAGPTRDTDDFNHGPRRINAQLLPFLTEPDENGCVFFTRHEAIRLPLRASGGKEANMHPSRAAWLAANPTSRITADEFAIHTCDGYRADLHFKSCCNADHMVKGDEDVKRREAKARKVRARQPKTAAA
jgi:hypothetical protein